MKPTVASMCLSRGPKGCWASKPVEQGPLALHQDVYMLIPFDPRRSAPGVSESYTLVRVPRRNHMSYLELQIPHHHGHGIGQRVLFSGTSKKCPPTLLGVERIEDNPPP